MFAMFGIGPTEILLLAVIIALVVYFMRSKKQ